MFFFCSWLSWKVLNVSDGKQYENGTENFKNGFTSAVNFLWVLCVILNSVLESCLWISLEYLIHENEIKQLFVFCSPRETHCGMKSDRLFKSCRLLCILQIGKQIQSRWTDSNEDIILITTLWPWIRHNNQYFHFCRNMETKICRF